MPPTVLRCGTLFDGTGAAPVRDAVILVRGRPHHRRRARARPHARARRRRASRPGRPLRDARPHRRPQPHLDRPRRSAIRSASSASGPVPQALRATREPPPRPRRRHDHACGSWPRSTSSTSRCATPSRPASSPGRACSAPRRGITASNGHGRALLGFDGVDEIRRGVRENFQRGADHVKIFATGGVSSPGTTLNVERLHARGDPRRRRGGRARRATTPPRTPTAGRAAPRRGGGRGAPSSTARSPPTTTSR